MTSSTTQDKWQRRILGAVKVSNTVAKVGRVLSVPMMVQGVRYNYYDQKKRRAADAEVDKQFPGYPKRKPSRLNKIGSKALVGAAMGAGLMNIPTDYSPDALKSQAKSGVKYGAYAGGAMLAKDGWKQTRADLANAGRYVRRKFRNRKVQESVMREDANYYYEQVLEDLELLETQRNYTVQVHKGSHSEFANLKGNVQAGSFTSEAAARNHARSKGWRNYKIVRQQGA